MSVVFQAATLAVVALLFSAGSAWADWDDGVAAYKRGDYVTAYQEFRPLAEQGDAKTQFNLGIMYAKFSASFRPDFTVQGENTCILGEVWELSETMII